MTELTTAPRPSPSPPAPPAVAGKGSWLAAVAIVPILASVYQTLVLTDVTDDVIRTGIDGEHYAMIWTTVCWGVATVYGVFAGIWAMARFGAGTPCWSGSAGSRWATCFAGRRPTSPPWRRRSWSRE